MLGSVLGWLLFLHLPAKDKQIAGLIETRDELVRNMTVSHQEAIKSLATDFRTAITESERRADIADKEKREDFRANLLTITSHYEKEVQSISGGIRREIDELNSVLGDLRKMIAEIRDKNMQLWSAPEPRSRRPGPNPPPTPPPSPGR